MRNFLCMVAVGFVFCLFALPVEAQLINLSDNPGEIASITAYEGEKQSLLQKGNTLFYFVSLVMTPLVLPVSGLCLLLGLPMVCFENTRKNGKILLKIALGGVVIVVLVIVAFAAFNTFATPAPTLSLY